MKWPSYKTVALLIGMPMTLSMITAMRRITYQIKIYLVNIITIDMAKVNNNSFLHKTMFMLVTKLL